MNLEKLLEELIEQNVRLSIRGDELLYQLPVEGIDSALLEKFKKHKEELIQIIQTTRKAKLGVSPIPKCQIEKSSWQLSSAQQRLWLLSQFEEASISYNMPFYTELTGKQDLKSFENAVYSTIDRHEVLRTIFKEDDKGEIKQWILSREEIGIKIEYRDFSFMANQQEKLMTFISEDASRPFDLQNGPLLRVFLLHLSNNRHVFYYNMHHVISDGWSMKVLARDVLSFYEAYKKGDKPNLPNLRIQYKDYAAWQLSQLNGELFLKNEKYWMSKLSGELPVIDFPSFKKRPNTKTFRGHTLKTYFSNEVTSKLKEYTQKNEGTLFITLLTSLNMMLYKYTGQDDIIIGSPVAGRNHIDLKNQIGFYVNTLVLRNQVNAKDSFDDLFANVKQSTFKDYEHENYPFNDLINKLSLRRDVSRNPIFDILLVFHNEDKRLDNSEISHPIAENIEEGGYGTSKFDLLFTFQEYGDSLFFSLEYNTDIYERIMMENFIVNYKTMIESLLAHSNQPISTINYLSEKEKNSVISKFNTTQVEFNHAPITVFLENQVSRTPDNIALKFKERTLTYKEINQKSNRIAHMLRDKYGVSPSTNVGVMMERSVDNIIAMIAILKSGACYVPIDYSYPSERVNFMLKDASIEIVLCNTEVSDFVQLEKRVMIDFRFLDSSNYYNWNPNSINRLDDPSYIIYTSGSTGNPKGVVQTHLMLSNLIQWGIKDSGIETGLKHLQYASFTFDASLHDVLFVLCSGGSLYLADDDIRLDYKKLKTVITKENIQVLSFPFSALNNFFDQNDFQGNEDNSIKHIISTGEQLYVSESLSGFLKNHPTIKLHNHYGPSESHVVTAYSMSCQEGNMQNRAPIGKPISNTQIYILDAYLQPVPIGVKGEIYIGGANLAIGYLNIPKITAERFIDSPFNPGVTLYKTGDIGYWTPKGIIEYLGRNDDQIKIRGFRVELKEIEKILMQLTYISNVTVIEFGEGDEKSLCAYLVTDQDIKTRAIRSYLDGKLPSYMVPSYFIKIASIPLTTNGKVDKKALPNPQFNCKGIPDEYVPPKDEIESKLVSIWEGLLDREKIGVADNFFELGGHSLKLVRLINIYHKTFNIEMHLKDLFALATIEKQAELIRIQHWLGTQQSKSSNKETLTF